MRKPQKRERVKVRVRKKAERLPVRLAIAQHFTLRPDPVMPHVVQLFISPDNRHMRKVSEFKDGHADLCAETMGAVRTFRNRITGKPVVRPGLVVARMFLNKRDIQARGSEIAAHECGHAAMAWARLRRADLATMDGEETMCYALGRMHRQLINLFWRIGVY